MFGVGVGNFWAWMAASAGGLGLAAAALRRGWWSPGRWGWRVAIWGLGSAMILYAVFFLGGIVVAQAGWSGQVAQVYSTRTQASPAVQSILLGLVIGPGEELFWRGLVQRHLTHQLGKGRGVAAASVVYALVHLASLNPALIAAALVCGLYWGVLYEATGSLIPGLISHSVWDVAIFVVFPLS